MPSPVIGIIGGADGPTRIFVAGEAFLFWLVILMLSVTAGIVLFLRISKKKKVNSMKEKDNPLRIAVLVSGGGTNLQALLDSDRSRRDAGEGCPYTVALVISSSKKAYALERAAAAGVPALVASPYTELGPEAAQTASRDEKRLAVSNRVLELCREHSIEAIVLAGFLTVLGGPIIEEFSGRIINLHPALLPKFGGEGMWGHHVHEAVLAAGEAESGCTIHLVDAGCDTGEILLQKRVPVLPDDTPESLYARIAPQEHLAMVEGVELLAQRLHGES